MFTFDKIPQSQLRNTNGYMPPSIMHTFFLLRSHCNIYTHQCEIYVRELAAESRRVNRTICKHLAWLVAKGFIHRQLRKKKDNPKENDKSLFTILRWELPDKTSHRADDTKNSVYHDFFGIQKDFRDSERESESKESNLKGKPELPSVGYEKSKAENPAPTLETENVIVEQEENAKSQNPSQPEVSAIEAVKHTQAQEEKPSARGQELDFTGIPDILLPTAEILMLHSERTRLEDYEIRCLKELLEKHTPARIQREIINRANAFKKRGRNPKSLKANYLHKILMGQPATYEPGVTGVVPSNRHAKGAKSAAKGQSAQTGCVESTSTNEAEHVVNEPVELAMPIEEAQKVIAEYEANGAVEEQKTDIPVALTELYGAIMEKIGESGTITVPDYLKLCLPEYDAEELYWIYNKSTPQRQVWAREAMITDRTCAKCTNPEQCRNRNCTRHVLSVQTRPDGEQCLKVDTDVSFQCKHKSESPEASPVYMKYVEASGLTAFQTEHTFDTYQCGTDELTVAKAKAIQAAKSGRNLVLAGRAGTGKTHLATAIAIEVMKQEKQAYVKNVPELLDEICQVASQFGDKYSLLKKYKESACLVLDDWDKVHMTDAKLGYLFEILDYRYNHGLQTIITTNAYDMAGMEFNRYTGKAEPLLSRLLQNGDLIAIRQAKNYRLTGCLRSPEAKKNDTPQPTERKSEPSSPVVESKDSDGFTEPTEAEWGELLDGGEFADYSDEERNELLFGTPHPEEYIAKLSDAGGGKITTTASVSEPKEDDEADGRDLELYGGLYTD